MSSALRPTLTLDEALQTAWDVVVVGAGPAGSMAARGLAQLGRRVLMIDRETFPRSKVCGCCVNRAALGLLEPPVRDLLETQGNRLRSYQLACAGRVASVKLSGGIAISRGLLDGRLISLAIDSGAEFLDLTRAVLQPAEGKAQLELKRGQETGTVGCKAAVLATGLGGSGHKSATGDSRRRSSRSYIGGGVILGAETPGFEPGQVSMACHRSGYVGMVRLEDGRLDLAAAFDARYVKRLGGLSHAAHQVLEEAGWEPPRHMHRERWQGTVQLTHRRAKLYGPGYFVVGDAAGYVEPFTGEGIAWAMAGGRAVATYAARAATESISTLGPAWSRENRRLLGRRMRNCRAVSYLLRQPRFVQLAVWALNVRPQLAGPIERSLSRPFPLAK